MKFRTLVFVAAMTGLSTGTAASAATYLLSFSGEVVSGVDNGRLFGVGTFLTGQNFKAEYLITVPTAGAIEDFAPSFRTYSGVGASNPVKGKLIIGKGSYDVGMKSGNADRYNNFFGNADIVSANAYTRSQSRNVPDISLEMSVSSVFRSFLNSTSFADSFDYFVHPDDYQSGYFLLPELNSNAQFNILRVTGSTVGVPEPATWGLMIAGFAAMGAAFRSQRKAATTPSRNDPSRV